MSSRNGGAPPTVRGLLEYEAEAITPKEMYPGIGNEKFAPSMKTARRMPLDEPPPLPPKEVLPELPAMSQPPQLPQLPQSSSPRGSPRSETNEALALISTQDLVAMDSLNTGVADMQIAPRGSNQQYGASPTSPSQRYLTYVPSMSGAQDMAELPGSPNSRTTPLPAYSSLSNPPPTYGGSPRTSTFRLAPDRYGHEIPMEAQWTKINRDRVSPEVLERAGVRYEARPTYVAVLGRLSREQIENYARQSADCRAARQMRQTEYQRPDYRTHERADSKSSRDDDDEESVLWDTDDDSTDYDDDKTSDKDTRSYPFIVSPPEKEKASPSSTVQPKSILKNKNENHVRFGPEPHEVESKSPHSLKDERERERERRRRREERHYNDRDRYNSDRERERDRDRHPRRYYDNRDRDHYSGRRRDYRERPDRPDRTDRRSKKKAWGETIGAVGLGGAAVSLLSVLAEAAASV